MVLFGSRTSKALIRDKAGEPRQPTHYTQHVMHSFLALFFSLRLHPHAQLSQTHTV
jgi:hypothetical protein